MTPSELCFKSIHEIAPLIKQQELSPVALTQAMLQRIDNIDGDLHSYLSIHHESALKQAKQAEQEINAGKYRGPLHGIPIAIKDMIFTQGISTSCASSVLENFVPDHNATVVNKLEEAGAIILGKLNMTEFALSGYHPDFEPPRNAWNPNHWSGVSSSGSGVATAAHLCFGSLGTDTGGSIRYPSAANGIVGIKPTYGRVSRHGVFPLSESLDHIGPMTNCVSDAAIMLNVIAGQDNNDPTSLREPTPDFCEGLGKGVKGLTIGLDENFIALNSDPRVTEAVLKAKDVLVSLGATVKMIDVSGINDVSAYWAPITAIEAAISHEALYPAKKEQYGPVFGGLLEAAHNDISGIDAAKGYALGVKTRGILDSAMIDVDFMLCPSMPMLPPTIDEMGPQTVIPPEDLPATLIYAAPFNFSGNPTISVPCGFSDNLPISLQLIGHHCGESTIIQAAHAYEQATDWHKQIAPAANA